MLLLRRCRRCSTARPTPHAAAVPHNRRLFIWILFAAAVVSAALQAWPDMTLILLVVIINVAIGLMQEGKAEKVRAVNAQLNARV